MPNHKIAMLVGSLREGSINRKVAKSICALKGDHLDCKMIEIGDVPLYNEDLDKDPPEQWVRLRREIAACDGILFCSPEYNRGIPGVLKNAIDVASRPYGKNVFDRKPAAVITASPGSVGGALCNHSIRQSCVFLNMPVMQQPEAYLGHVNADSFNDDGTLRDGPFKEVVTKLAYAFADWVTMIRSACEMIEPDAAHVEVAQKEHATI